MNQTDIDFLENQRKVILTKSIILIVLFIGSLFLCFVNPLLTICGFVGSVLFYFFGVNSQMKSFTKSYKMLVVEGPLQKAFPGCQYHPEDGFSESTIQATQLMQRTDRFHSEDLILGNYKGINFERADLKLEDEYRDKDGHTHTTTIFLGRWMIFQFPKPFRYDIQIVQQGFGGSKSNTGIFVSKTARKQKVMFEDHQFNQEFRCYATNEHEAFYVVTPQIMEAVKRIASLMDGKIMFGFVNNQLHVAVESGKNAFEPSITRSLSYQKDILAINSEINAITTIVNQFNLDQSIYQ